MKLPLAPLLAALAIVVALGVAHGIATDRWGPSGRLERSLATLEHVPMSFGDWKGDDQPYEPEDMARAGIRGGVHRRYRNARTQEAVSLLLVCGRGGPISVHTPDVCYGGSGYQPIGGTTYKDLDLKDSGKHTFRIDRFGMPQGVSPSQLEVWLAWSQDGRNWEAPENARYSLARSPALYKLYVVREYLPRTGNQAVESRATDANPDSCEVFLNRALPDLIKVLPPGIE